MASNLMIVESPAKAKTIEKFLGKDFIVKSCYGHVRDLEKSNFGIDIDKNYQPRYVVSPDKKKLVSELKKLAKEAEQVWLATDEDREGEAISWHLCEVLGLDPKIAKRIVFHEITKDAILKAVSEPRNVNLDQVNAQQARRILDRLVGFELSPVLWKKVTQGSSLSAGRVQSVAVRLIVEREGEINDFTPESSFRITADFLQEAKSGPKYTIGAELSQRLSEYEDALTFLKDCEGARYKITDIQVKPAKKSPPGPFTTSTLQQDASRKLGFSVTRTMVVAQKLYEAGHITYMRTDSVNLSEQALGAMKAEIHSSYGADYFQPRKFKTKDSKAQEAHEAIRPTYFDKQNAGGSSDEKKLYSLIWKRAMASQMSDARFERTRVTIDVSTREENFIAKGEVLKFDGFLKIYNESVDDEGEESLDGILPPMKDGESLNLDKMLATERFTRHLPRYTEASLVKKLEELGIGRPSTYAPTITTIQKRNYVVKEDRDGVTRKYRVLELAKQGLEKREEEEKTGAEKSKLFPTDIGILVNNFLMDHFDEVMDYNFTARIEEQFDDIALGGLEWPEMIDSFYVPFHKSIEKTLEEAERVTGERILGKDPKTGREILVRMGKYGPMAQIGRTDEEEKPRYAKLLPDQNLLSIELEDALELFKLPRTLGEFRDEKVIVSQGRFGPYVRFGSKFCSLKKEDDPMTIDLERAIVLIKEKEVADANKFIKEFTEEGIQVLNGRFGPYIKQGKNNFKIPKGVDPKTLELSDCEKIIKETATKKKRKVKK